MAYKITFFLHFLWNIYGRKNIVGLTDLCILFFDSFDESPIQYSHALLLWRLLFSMDKIPDHSLYHFNVK